MPQVVGDAGHALAFMLVSRSLSPSSLGLLVSLRSLSWLAGSTLKWCL